ncbi:hypothetical protein JHU04_001199 [Brenneria sp. 4F2]|nr:hypothetical protein [Brenneria bubanii]
MEFDSTRIDDPAQAQEGADERCDLNRLAILHQHSRQLRHLPFAHGMALDDGFAQVDSALPVLFPSIDACGATQLKISLGQLSIND